MPDNNNLFDRVAAVLEEVRPLLVADGGDLELISVSQGVAEIRLKGACVDCPLAGITVKFTIEQALKEALDDRIYAVKIVS